MELIDIYATVHTPLVLILCISASAGHILSISLLMRMLNPTNLLLMSMSCCQLALCVNFLYSTMFKYGSEELCVSALWSFGWTSTLLFSVNLSVFVHLLSTFHVVALSIIRHLSLKHLENINSKIVWFSYRKCIYSLVIVYISAVLVCAPLYFQSEVVERPIFTSGCKVDARFAFSRDANSTADGRRLTSIAYRLAFSENTLLQSVNFWLFGGICKLIPCSILALMTYFIIRSLKALRSISVRISRQNMERDKQHHRTTTIILVVMFFFVIVELPQGVLAVAQSFFEIAYLDFWGDLFEVLTFFNSCLIFALFCSMNSRIRSAFFEYSNRLCFRWWPSKVESNGVSLLSRNCSPRQSGKSFLLLKRFSSKNLQNGGAEIKFV